MRSPRPETHEPPTPNQTALPPLTRVQLVTGAIGDASGWIFHDDRRPAVWALLGGACAFLFCPKTAIDKVISEVLPTAVSVASILTALMSISQSIMLSLLDKPVVAYMKSEGFYADIVQYHRSSFLNQLRFIALGLLAMVFRSAGFKADWYERSAIVALAFTGVIAWFCTKRLMNLMFKMLLKQDSSGRR